MPFGLVTRRQLDAKLDQLREEMRKGFEFEEEIRYEWARWYDKFRSLYMTLLKREKKAAEVAPGDTIDETPPPAAPLFTSPMNGFRSRRGF